MLPKRWYSTVGARYKAPTTVVVCIGFATYLQQFQMLQKLIGPYINILYKEVRVDINRSLALKETFQRDIKSLTNHLSIFF